MASLFSRVGTIRTDFSPVSCSGPSTVSFSVFGSASLTPVLFQPGLFTCVWVLRVFRQVKNEVYQMQCGPFTHGGRMLTQSNFSVDQLQVGVLQCCSVPAFHKMSIVPFADPSWLHTDSLHGSTFHIPYLSFLSFFLFNLQCSCGTCFRVIRAGISNFLLHA